MNYRPVWAAALALASLFWTGQGESANPVLTAMELPLNIVSDCSSGCAGERAPFAIHWLGRSAQGNIYVVNRARCTDSDCGAWLVEKTRRGVDTLLSMDGRFKLVRAEQAFPEVEVERDISDIEVAYSRYRWQAGAYVRVEDKRLYRVDGVECGTAEECNLAATAALQNRDTARALRIWEKVHKVAWI